MFQSTLLIATRLSQNQKFLEAQTWFHYVFDPTDNIEFDIPLVGLVAEPGGAALFGAAAGGLLWLRRRKAGRS